MDTLKNLLTKTSLLVRAVFLFALGRPLPLLTFFAVAPPLDLCLDDMLTVQIF